MTIAQIDKNRLRREARTRRGEAAIAFPDAGVRLADNLDALRRSETRWIDGASVSAFWPMGDEIDVRPTMRRLDAAGYPILLPVMVAKATPLMFRRWRPDTVLVDGGFGTSMPPADAPEGTPDVLLVPLLSFDRRGYRLGYGGGFYDRTLEALAARGILAVGVGFADQEVDAVPRDAHDWRLDGMVTEREIIRVE